MDHFGFIFCFFWRVGGKGKAAWTFFHRGVGVGSAKDHRLYPPDSPGHDHNVTTPCEVDRTLVSRYSAERAEARRTPCKSHQHAPPSKAEHFCSSSFFSPPSFAPTHFSLLQKQEDDRRFSFVVEWLDPHAGLTFRYQLMYWAADCSIEMVRTKRGGA